MSKPSSGLFSQTIGTKNKSTVKNSPDNATQNHRHVVLWAQKKAVELSSKSMSQRRKFNTATVAYDEQTGNYYYGRNGGIDHSDEKRNPILFGDNKTEGILPQTSLNKYPVGNCSEVDAINKALNAGAELKNLHITTIHATPRDMGRSKPSCQNCTYSFRGQVKRNYTGWYKEEES